MDDNGRISRSVPILVVPKQKGIDTMNLKRPWIVATATVALAGFGTTLALASEDTELNDRQQAPVVELVDDNQPGQVDHSPESADSPGASPFDSANSASDSPGDAGFQRLVPAAAPAGGSLRADSANSPAPAPRVIAPSVDSANSPWGSAGSVGSAGSPG